MRRIWQTKGSDSGKSDVSISGNKFLHTETYFRIWKFWHRSKSGLVRLEMSWQFPASTLPSIWFRIWNQREWFDWGIRNQVCVARI